MRILVTNDDGIHAPGLEVAERIARRLSGDVWVVAPEYDQSGVAHALSISDPVRLRQAGEKRYAVRGTPTDCVIMALKVVIGEKPDLVISGVNRGQNMADDVTYSGTVAGAMEGTLLGIPSVALSQAYGYQSIGDPKWETAEAYAPEILSTLIAQGFGGDVLYNINFPNCEPSEVNGVVVTRQGRRVPDWLKVDKRADGRGHPYYWIGFQRAKMDPEEGTDLAALANRQVSVTPLSLNLTDEPALGKLAGVFS
ncbi:5'/3'-nucleotidase SurE [Propylenella binzhouense]|uniref:5'-nucleotidase SurE n=1 Tax=Propylenella binzhouense TaxID=2555902 RepID=A0A964T4I0_9HYPH|nr:5'/3'-nucleotidase SurE [Propylenella binzhouense]MYZ47367.1 5'/3'-nucleotidase SurE [Propylenella binzhouense]